MTTIHIPHNGWMARDHQVPLWKYLAHDNGKRAMAVWHRRAGKDEVALHYTFVAMCARPGSYWHCLPEYEQARKAIWTSVNAHTGKRRIDEVFPEAARETCDEGKMFLRLRNGSTWQCIGSDNYSATVGAGVAGIVYSEWALANPSAWAYHRPMVEENNGWATFITTPRGRNHAYALYNHACKSPEWFSELLTVEDTHALTPEALATALKEYCALYGEDAGRAAYQQEYFCDWAAAVLGAVYAREMAQLRNEGRIDEVEALPDQYVHRAWDLGTRNDTSIWWFQIVGAQIFVLDHLAQSGVGVEWFADEIAKREKKHGWLHGTDFVPHDAMVKEWGSGRTRVETMQKIGLKPLLVPLSSVQDGIQAVRRTLPLCVFHPRCEEGDFSGISALEQHHREWDDEKKAFRANAFQDWTCHPCDAFRYLSLSWRHAPRREVAAPKVEGFVIPPPEEPRHGGMRI